MTKIDNLLSLIEQGIRAESMRQKAIASNVANIETPGYRRVDVQFSELLAKAIESGKDVDLDKIDPELFQPENTPVKANGNDVTLELEVGQMVKNTLRHQTYIRLLQKKYAQIDMAINLR